MMTRGKSNQTRVLLGRVEVLATGRSLARGFVGVLGFFSGYQQIKASVYEIPRSEDRIFTPRFSSQRDKTTRGNERAIMNFLVFF